MRILFLDDSPVRRQCFRTKYPDALCVTTSKACIDALQKAVFELVFLDYDLLGDDTGSAVTAWIWSNKPLIGAIIVHSTNIYGAMMMLQTLRAAGYHAEYVPFRLDGGGPFHL